MKRSWEVYYDLAYDGGSGSIWTKKYRTYYGARIAMFWHKYISSWGGTTVLTYIYKES